MSVEDAIQRRLDRLNKGEKISLQPMSDKDMTDKVSRAIRRARGEQV